MRLRSLLPVLLLIAVSYLPAAAVQLTSGGTSFYQVTLPADPDPLEVRAAEELDRYFTRISGARSLVCTQPTVTIEIGRAANNALLRERAATDPSGFFIEVTGDTVRLAGTTPTATLYAAYALLERIGCRWFMPGEIGEVVPRLGQVSLEQFSAVEVPHFTGRILQTLPKDEASELWALRNRLGGAVYPGAHSWNRLLPPSRYFETNPEYYALVDGERSPKQICTSNPMVIAHIAAAIIEEHTANPEKTWFGIGPNDGGGFCECYDCVALDTGDIDPFTGEESITDRFLTFANAVAEQVHQVYPDIKFAFYAYHNYMLPPKEVMPDPSIIPAIAPIGLCRIHGMGNAVCAERNFHQYLISEWTKISPEVYHRGYSYNLAAPDLPMNYASRWGYEIPYCERAGITGFRVETSMSWANQGPLGWLMAKLMWNADQDPQLLLDDFYNQFYGPAAQPMGRYWSYMDRLRRNAPYHTGNAVNIPDIYSGKDMNYLSERLYEAMRSARTHSPYADRVDIAKKSWDYLHAFLRMREASEQHNWKLALEALDDMRTEGQWLQDYEPMMLQPSGGLGRLERFWAPEVEQGYERTNNGNRLVAAFDDTWRTFMDPTNAGEFLRYWSIRTDDSDWQEMKTYSASWSDQGLRYYRGPLWYRQKVKMWPEWGGRRLVLWLGGVDESAKVWVNDTYIGEIQTNGWQPAELDVTHAIRFGRENLFAIKVTNNVTNELGTGGITRPVMIWSPNPEPVAEENAEE